MQYMHFKTARFYNFHRINIQSIIFFIYSSSSLFHQAQYTCGKIHRDIAAYDLVKHEWNIPKD